MNNKLIYKRNKQVGMVVLGILWVLLIACLILLNVLLKSLASALGIGETNLRLILNLATLTILGIATMYYVLAWDKVSIELTNDSVVLSKSMIKKMIAYTNISSVIVQQNRLGKIHNFGTIQINFSTGENPLIVHTIENINELSSHIKERSTTSKQTVKIARD